jgi:hypothetical protein
MLSPGTLDRVTMTLGACTLAVLERLESGGLGDPEPVS